MKLAGNPTDYFNGMDELIWRSCGIELNEVYPEPAFNIEYALLNTFDTLIDEIQEELS